MSPRVRASDGHGFQIGNTELYIGPGRLGLSKPPVLAFMVRGAKKPVIVASFTNASTAELFISALTEGIELLTGRLIDLHPEIRVDELATSAEVEA
jgi:hypothetical protein